MFCCLFPQDLNLCDDAILMMSCLVFIINYEKSQSSPPVPPVTSIVCTWGGMDTANIDVRVDKTDRGDYVFNVSWFMACYIDMTLSILTYLLHHNQFPFTYVAIVNIQHISIH